jgi:hypothetical protein
LVAEMHTVEHADREEEWARKPPKFRDGMEDLHDANDE